MNAQAERFQDQRIGRVNVLEDQGAVKFSYAPGNGFVGLFCLLWLTGWSVGTISMLTSIANTGSVHFWTIVIIVFMIKLLVLGIALWHLCGRFYMRIDYIRIETGYEIIVPIKWSSFKAYEVSSAMIIEDSQNDVYDEMSKNVIRVQSLLLSKSLFFGTDLNDHELLGVLYFVKNRLKRFGISCASNASQFVPDRPRKALANPFLSGRSEPVQGGKESPVRLLQAPLQAVKGRLASSVWALAGVVWNLGIMPPLILGVIHGQWQAMLLVIPFLAIGIFLGYVSFIIVMTGIVQFLKSLRTVYQMR